MSRSHADPLRLPGAPHAVSAPAPAAGLPRRGTPCSGTGRPGRAPPPHGEPRPGAIPGKGKNKGTPPTTHRMLGWSWVYRFNGTAPTNGSWLRFHLLNENLNGPGDEIRNLVPARQMTNQNPWWRGLDDEAIYQTPEAQGPGHLPSSGPGHRGPPGPGPPALLPPPHRGRVPDLGRRERRMGSAGSPCRPEQHRRAAVPTPPSCRSTCTRRPRCGSRCSTPPCPRSSPPPSGRTTSATRSATSRRAARGRWCTTS